MKRDPLTKEEFLPKSISQRFASPENRIKFHNLNAKALRHSSAFINKPLHVNLRVLNELMKGKNKAFFHKEFMLGKGFSFEVLTNYTEWEGKRYPQVYKFIIIPFSDEKIQIIKMPSND